MKPPPFEYHAPAALDEALGLLDRLGDEAKVIAGGQSLVPMMNLRLAWPAALVDLNGLGELRYLLAEDGQLRVGALVRQREIERSALARECCPLLADAMRFIGHAATRTRGTVAGSVAHADPAAEIPTVLAALDGEVVVQGRAGRRVVAAGELFEGYFSTALEAGEIITEVRFPAVRTSGNGHAFVEFARRFGDFALAGVAASVDVDAGGDCTSVRIGLCGAGARPLRARRSEAAVRDGNGSPAACADAGRLAAEDAEPPSDLHGDAEYRRELVATLCERAVRTAVARARGEEA